MVCVRSHRHIAAHGTCQTRHRTGRCGRFIRHDVWAGHIVGTRAPYCGDRRPGKRIDTATILPRSALSAWRIRHAAVAPPLNDSVGDGPICARDGRMPGYRVNSHAKLTKFSAPVAKGPASDSLIGTISPVSSASAIDCLDAALLPDDRWAARPDRSSTPSMLPLLPPVAAWIVRHKLMRNYFPPTKNRGNLTCAESSIFT